MVKAADLLAGQYTLVITNVPYLARGKQSTILKDFCEHHFPLSRTDLATVFLERASDTLSPDGVIALVAPQAWQAQTAYETFRDRILSRRSLILIGRLGPRAFETISGEVVNVGLYMIQKTTPNEESRVRFVEAVADKNAQDKARTLRNGAITGIVQSRLWEVQGHVISAVMDAGVSLLEACVESVQGIKSGDDPWLCRNFWEMVDPRNEWRFEQGTTKTTMPYGGREKIIWWANSAAFARFQGQSAWDREGVIVNQMANLNATIFKGEAFDGTVSCIVPTDARIVPALWTFCSSKEYVDSVRSVDNALGVSNSSLAKVPFDLAHWQKVAAEKYPHGLPEPESDDPTQWLFHGYPYEAREEVMLQVAVARLLGYRWPAEDPHPDPLPEGEGEMGMRLSKRARALVKQCEELAKFADNDGIVCIPAVRGEEPAAARLEALLSAAGIKPEQMRELAGGTDLDDWLRNGFFEQHCKLFHDRPFVWHIWDGRKRDGFHALVNYHKLCEEGGKGRRLLESLTYAYLGEWITRQKDDVKRGESGAEDRLAAALELQKRLVAILEGDPPFDIFVRWKPLAKQPIGWEPDINDGVRLNIRPFLASDLPDGKKGAGILRYKPNIKWTKDRGKEPQRPKEEYPWFWNWDEKTADFIGGKSFDGNRWNDCHYTNKIKQAARAAGKDKT